MTYLQSEIPRNTAYLVGVKYYVENPQQFCSESAHHITWFFLTLYVRYKNMNLNYYIRNHDPFDVCLVVAYQYLNSYQYEFQIDDQTCNRLYVWILITQKNRK